MIISDGQRCWAEGCNSSCPAFNNAEKCIYGVQGEPTEEDLVKIIPDVSEINISDQDPSW